RRWMGAAWTSGVGTCTRPVMRPEVFYKYRSADQTLALLSSRQVMWCSPLLFNDPFDTHDLWRFGFDLADAGPAIAARMKRLIFYAPDRPTIASTADEWAAHISGEALIDMEAAFLRIAFTKSEHWSYEQEWRCHDILDDDDGGLMICASVDAEEIAAVHLGCQ